MSSYIYAVITVPWDSVSVSKYCQTTYYSKSEGKWGQTGSSCVGNLFGVLNKPVCGGGSNTVVFSCLPVNSSSPIKCSASNQIYPVMLAAGQIPLVSYQDPSQMTAAQINDPNNMIKNYAGPTDVATTGQLVPSQTGCGYLPTPDPTMVLVYPASWFLAWTDLDRFFPASFNGQSHFLNTGTDSSAQFTYQGQPIPQLEDQVGALLSSFCAQVSGDCPDNINPLPNPQPGGPTNYGYCSYIFANRPGGPTVTNYCNVVYNALNSNDYPVSATAAVGQAMTTYCQLKVPNTSIYPECLCVNPMGSTYYAALYKAATQANINVNNPYTPDSGFTNSFGNIGCWWFPCQSATTTLVPQSVQSASCPNVCKNVVDIINSGTLNLSGANITQDITCCVGNQCTGPPTPPPSSGCTPACSSSQACINGQCQATPCGTGEACPSGQSCVSGSCVVPCSVDSDCPSDEVCSGGTCIPKTAPSQTFWQKYWWVILIGILVVLFLLVLLWLMLRKP